MENSCLLSLLEKFRKGDMSVFPVVFSEFEGLIHHYTEKSDAEDTAEELSVFLLELLYKLDLPPLWEYAATGFQDILPCPLETNILPIQPKILTIKNLNF